MAPSDNASYLSASTFTAVLRLARGRSTAAGMFERAFKKNNTHISTYLFTQLELYVGLFGLGMKNVTLAAH